MSPRSGLILCAAALILFAGAGCATNGGTSGGWVVVGQPDAQPPAPAKTGPPPSRERPPGQEVAARNHLRSAYRFLQKNKPDHAMRELEKARSRMGHNFWYHYYLGGAFYLKGMMREARSSWEAGFRYTGDQRLRSRVRTLQSFALISVEGRSGSATVLRVALDLDHDNRMARALLRDLGEDSAGRDRYPDQPDSPYAGEMVRRGQGGDDDRYRDDDDRDDDDRYDDDRYGDDDDDKGRGRSRGKSRGHREGRGKEKKYMVQDRDEFRSYFLIEMP